ncbi:CocE/NonD family hydrolase [Micromonospora sp. WMMC241]|uniref:CocE/NonD family hydrolase n=1 Tax=Micromonospora sp. WMMC241 TaxID=3015159 RepID=UPI0022B6BDDB|nr:CocE/NonD family hydrolase [Micromonospora sp. WMMC241]MCZ7436755.1 CocE/NonD family hydrolase [Micromonospora sp. WMMC241]
MTSLRHRLSGRLRRVRRHASPEPSYAFSVRRRLRVPMDDGVDLVADLYLPVGPVEPPLPTVVVRSPYGRHGSLTHAPALAGEGFPVLVQSCRGTGGSGGIFRPQLDEQRDGMATHRWVRRQPWFTGAVATHGESYLGYTQWAVAGRMCRDDPGNAPDALCLNVTMADFGAVTWNNGAFALGGSLGWSRRMVLRGVRGALVRARLARRPDRKLAEAFDVLPLSRGDTAVAGRPIGWYQDWLAHEKLSDDYWTRQSHTASVPDVTAPVYMATGWYDIFLPWQLRNYAQLAAAGRPPRLTIGPWGHGSDQSPFLAESIAFLKEHFAGAPAARPAPVRAFLTGAEQWHDLPAWPPPGTAAQRWYLHPCGLLDAAVPDGGSTRYTYDPDQPTPAVGGPGPGPVDNGAHERRADVVVFRGPPLDHAVVLAGEPIARVRFRSTAASADVFIRICDVHPDGRSMGVCDGIRRIGGVGTAGSDPLPDEDGFVELEVPLWPAFHRFAAGHRVAVQVSSGAHPRYARNPGGGEPAATATTTVRARQEISHAGAHPSRLDLPVWGGPAANVSTAA